MSRVDAKTLRFERRLGGLDKKCYLDRPFKEENTIVTNINTDNWGVNKLEKLVYEAYVRKGYSV